MLATRMLLLSLVFLVEVPGEEKLSPRRHAQEGETCLVCNGRTSEADAAYLANGQRAAMHALDCCEGEFLKDPGAWMAKLRPSNMIFGAFTGSHLSDRWIWLGLYTLLGLVFGGLSAHEAVRKGRPAARWFFLGLFFSVTACVYLALQPSRAANVPPGFRKVPLTRDPLPCNGCGHTNHPAASLCSRCGLALQPSAPSEVAAARRT